MEKGSCYLLERDSDEVSLRSEGIQGTVARDVSNNDENRKRTLSNREVLGSLIGVEGNFVLRGGRSSLEHRREVDRAWNEEGFSL